MNQTPWFNYIIEIVAPEGGVLETHTIPGVGNDFPYEQLQALTIKFGGVGYEFRIRTKLRPKRGRRRKGW